MPARGRQKTTGVSARKAIGENLRNSGYREVRVGGELRGGRHGRGGRGGCDGRGVGRGGGGGRRRVVEVDDAAGVEDPRASAGRGGDCAGELEGRYRRCGGRGGRVAGERGERMGGGSAAAAGADFVGGDCCRGGGRGGVGEVDGLDSQDEHDGWVRWAFGPFPFFLAGLPLLRFLFLFF